MHENKMIYAPIVLFVYSRPIHTEKTLNALSKDPLSKKSTLIIFSDAPKTSNDQKSVGIVREIIKNYSNCFQKVSIFERDQNYGLAKNIISGVTQVMNKNKCAIILEDDMIVSPFFLSFMNSSLEKYENHSDVWHISGWNYPISSKGLEDCFFWRGMSCWGWATWSNRWMFFKKEPDKLLDTFNRKQIYNFNLDGTNHSWSQITANQKGEIDTWAIFWSATIFLNGGVCLNPSISLIENIGLDGSGVHCSKSDTHSITVKPKAIQHWPRKVNISRIAERRIKLFYLTKRFKQNRYIKKIINILIKP